MSDARHVTLTYTDVAGSVTEPHPTLAEAVGAYYGLDQRLQLTAVIGTPSARYDFDGIRRLNLRKMMDGLGSEAGYLARSEGVKSRGTVALARKAMIEPGALTREEIRKLAAAILAHEKYGK